jgi:glycosyltransferase involved in cell wall biosynthesis
MTSSEDRKNPTRVEPEIDASTRTLVVDVTAVSGQAFFTGVQRMVREFCESHPKDVLLVRFDGKNKVFRTIPRLGRLRYRSAEGWRGRLRLKLKSFYWNASRQFREQGSRRGLLPKFVRNWARRFYEAFLSDTQLERNNAFQRRPIWQPQTHQTFFLIDIPVSQTHISALIELVDAHDVRSVAYLHDLFPLSHKQLFDPVHHPGVRARHLRYLDLVTTVDEVVCNSEFTKSQYERFTSLMENLTHQKLRVVYPPWPQFTKRTDDSSETVEDVFAGADVRILAVGALDQRKNLVVLLSALSLLTQQGVDARLVLVSGATGQIDPSFRAEMLSLSDNVRGRVEILNQVSDNRLAEIYEDASVVAVPSLAEGFGLPVVEGLRKGRPVVAASTTALSELAELLPVRLADPHDATAWATALLEASNSGGIAPLTAPAEFPRDWIEFRSRVVGSRD